ncbi:MAG: FAD-dependent oxidoreductase [Gammaproteobacteria bacterium]
MNLRSWDELATALRSQSRARQPRVEMVESSPQNTRYDSCSIELEGIHQQAVSSISYTRFSIVFLLPRSPFWEKDGLSDSMTSNGLASTMYAQKFGKDPDEVTGFNVSGLLPGARKPHGRIHFCAEHTATTQRGMEGAMESAERAPRQRREALNN